MVDLFLVDKTKVTFIEEKNRVIGLAFYIALGDINEFDAIMQMRNMVADITPGQAFTLDINREMLHSLILALLTEYYYILVENC